MSDEKRDADRPVRDIDLGKDAVTDVTPPAAAATAKPEPVGAPEMPPRPATTPAASEGGRAGPVIGGAVAGGVVGILSAVFFQHFERPAVTVADPRVAQVETAIAAVERKTVDAAQIEQRLLAQIKAAEGKVATISQQAETSVQRAAAVEGRAVALEQKAAKLEQQAAAAEQRAALAEQRAAEIDAKAAAVVAPVADRVKAVESRVVEGRDQAVALSRRVDLLAQIEPPKVDLRPVITRIDELERAVNGATARVTLNGEAAIAVEGRVKGLEQTFKSLETAAGSNGAALAAMGSTVKTLENAIANAGRRPVETASAVIAVAQLTRRMVQQGEAVGGPVAALQALGVPEADMRPLAALANQPALSAARLSELYGELAGKLPKSQPAVAAPAKTDSLVDRVTSGLWSQVDVRPVGTAAKPDATGLGADIRQKLAAQDWRGAQALVAGLASDQQAGLKPFSDALAVRIEALSALSKIERDVLAASTRKG